MKKCLNFILLMLCIFICSTNVDAKTTLGFTFKAIKEAGEIKWKTKTFDILHNAGKFEGEDNKLAFCIDPGIEYLSNSKGKYYVYNDYASIQEKTGFDESLIRKLSLISRYGYGDDNDTSDSMYIATQLELWEAISPGCCNLVGKDLDIVNQKRKMIMTHVQTELQLPSFFEEQIIVSPNVKFEVIDRNNVLNGYKVKECINCSAQINENILTVKTNSVGESEIILTKEFDSIGDTNYLYDKEDYQQLMRFEYVPSLEVSLKIQSIQGKLIINKVDLETGKNFAQGDGTLKGAEYTVYDIDKNIVGIITTDESGYGEIDLNLGKYYIKETKPSSGYLMDQTEYDVILTSDNHQVTITSNEKVIKGKIEILKLYGDDELGFKYEPGAEFEIINSQNKIVSKITTDKSGLASYELPYGTYYLRQVKGLENYTLSKDIKFKIDEHDQVLNFTIKNISYPRLEITKKDIVSGKTLEGATFHIYKLNELTKEYELYSSEISGEDGKILLSNLELGKYYLQEVEAPIGYILNDEKVYVDISEFGKTYKFELFNEKIKGTLKVLKVNEENVPLEGVTIGIYDSNDNFISECITNEQGIIEIELEYGTYYYQEISTIDGYILSTEKVYFDISENDKILEYTLVNVKEIIEVPNTFDNDYTNILMLGVISLGAVYIIYGIKNKKEI